MVAKDLQQLFSSSCWDKGMKLAVMASSTAEDISAIGQRDIADFCSREWNSLAQEQLASSFKLDRNEGARNQRSKRCKEDTRWLESFWKIAPNPQTNGPRRMDTWERSAGPSPNLFLVGLHRETVDERLRDPELSNIERGNLLSKLG